MASAKKTAKKRGRKPKEVDPAAEKAKKETKRKKKQEDVLAFRDRMKQFGQELLRQRRAALEEARRYKRMSL